MGKIKRIRFDPRKATEELDKLFEQMSAENSAMPEYDDDALTSGQLRADLFSYQKKGVAWMLSREASLTKPASELPPFWQREGSSFFNTITNSITEKRPAHVCGGVLADDMGLGKTLQMIAVIVHDLVKSGSLKSQDGEVPQPRRRRRRRRHPMREQGSEMATLVVAPASVISS